MIDIYTIVDRDNYEYLIYTKCELLAKGYRIIGLRMVYQIGRNVHYVICFEGGRGAYINFNIICLMPEATITTALADFFGLDSRPTVQSRLDKVFKQ